MKASKYVPADRPGTHFDMFFRTLRCPGCDSDLTAAGSVLIGRIVPSEDAPLLPVGRTRIVPLDRHPAVGLVEDTRTLNACLYDGRYACVFCRRGVEDLGTEIVWQEPRELEEQVEAAVAEMASSPPPASELLLKLLLRRASYRRYEQDSESVLDRTGEDEREATLLRELAAGLAELAEGPADGTPQGGVEPSCGLLWGRVPAARTPDILGLDVVQRLTTDHPAEGHHGAFVRHLRQLGTDGLRNLCRRLWAESPWPYCHVEGYLADAGRLGDAGAEAAYLRLLARSLWAETLDERRAEILAAVGAFPAG